MESLTPAITSISTQAAKKDPFGDRRRRHQGQGERRLLAKIGQEEKEGQQDLKKNGAVIIRYSGAQFNWILRTLLNIVLRFLLSFTGCPTATVLQNSIEN